jgi:hypothetical protein
VAEMKAGYEKMMARLDAHHERMGASANAWRIETTACREVTGLSRNDGDRSRGNEVCSAA